MKKRIIFGKRLLAVMLLLLMMFSMATAAFPVSANVTKVEKKYEIAVVFDNSGSMYGSSNAAWCRAKYAMEIFASMLNYSNGDVLKIYPMWEVVTDGTTPDFGGSYAPIEIKQIADVDKISKLYTVSPSGTPFAPITEAHNDLSKSGADEKWLVVLTDGLFNQEERNANANIDLQTRLPALAKSGIKVQYLGFGDAASLSANEAAGFYSKKSTDTSLKDDLIDICNNIFQRSELKGKLSGKTLTLDMSMKSVIIFAQGSNAKITSLKNSSGKEISKALDSGQRKYSTIAAGGSYKNSLVDKSLAGQVVTFSACEKGTYTLEHSGADKIQIFYEPDVDVKISLINNDGQEIDASADSLASGEYKLQYSLRDSKTGEDVTSSPLLGKVNLKGFLKGADGSIIQDDIKNGGTIKVDPQGKIEIHVSGTYLEKYKISTENSGEGLIFDGGVTAPALKAAVEVTQSSAWYNTKEHDSWKPIRVSLQYDGNPLTDEQLQNTALDVKFSGDIKYKCEPIPGESAFNIYICTDENGEYAEAENGRYTAAVKASYDSAVSEEAKASFEIHPYGVGVRNLIIGIILLVILLILALITVFLHKLKVLPNRVVAKNAEYIREGAAVGAVSASINANKKMKIFTEDGAISVHSTKGNFGIILHVKPDHTLFNWLFSYQKSPRRYYRITKITKGSPGVSSVIINGREYTAEEFDKINCRTKNPSIEVNGTAAGESATLRCSLRNEN